MRCILVHGFNVSDGGAGSVDTLRAFLELRGCDCDGRAWEGIEQFDYGWTFLLGVRFGNPGRARRLYERLSAPKLPPGGSGSAEAGASGVRDEGFVGVGHSNGCTILLEAAKRGAEFTRLVFVNPALGRKAKLPPQVQRCDVFYTVDDPWTWMARWLPLHPWGDLGNAGYRGADPRWVSWNMSKGIRRQPVASGQWPVASESETPITDHRSPSIEMDGVWVTRKPVEGFAEAIHAPHGHSGVFQGGAAKSDDPEALYLAHYFWMPQIAAAAAGALE